MDLRRLLELPPAKMYVFTLVPPEESAGTASGKSWGPDCKLKPAQSALVCTPESDPDRYEQARGEYPVPSRRLPTAGLYPCCHVDGIMASKQNRESRASELHCIYTRSMRYGCTTVIAILVELVVAFTAEPSAALHQQRQIARETT